MQAIKIDNKYIGEGYPCYIIAEISANHNQDFNQAKHLIKLAKESGADAVKFQTYTPDTMTLDCSNEFFQIKEGPWKGQTLYELYKKAYTPWDWFKGLKEYADSLDITLFSTPFDKTSVDLLESIKVPAYKIASFELVDIPLIEYVASKGKPVILSTGMGSLAEIELAVNTIRKCGNDQIILLKCTSDYPAKPEDMNLSEMGILKNAFNVQIGLSDHSLGNELGVGAVCLGAKVIEKHFVENRNSGGPDAAFSMEPRGFANLVQSVHLMESSLGNPVFKPTINEMKNIKYRKSIFVVDNISQGDVFSPENIKVIRPGFGLEPRLMVEIIGKKAACDIQKGSPLALKHIQY